VSLSQLSIARPVVRLLVLATVLTASVLTQQGARPGDDGPHVMPAAVAASGNPLVGPWGRYLVKTDEPYRAYLRATGTSKALLAKIALQPRVRWFGTWIPTTQVGKKIRNYVKVSQRGDPNALVQLAVFRLWPNGGEPAAKKPLSAADQEAYRAWVRAAAAAIGASRVAIVLEPDLAVALKGWRPDVRFALTNYAARVFAALPRTTVYLDASDADWLNVEAAVTMLRASGVAHVRGFAVGATHYWSVAEQEAFGRTIVARLAAAGIPDRHYVVDTADNGRPFTWSQYYAAHPRGDFDNAETCRTTTQPRCVTLGRRPTWSTADPAHNDGYLWFGRPWLTRQASPFDPGRALAIARTTPY
jgi:endoglucanase